MAALNWQHLRTRAPSLCGVQGLSEALPVGSDARADGVA